MRFTTFLFGAFLAVFGFASHALAASINITKDVIVNGTTENVWDVIGDFGNMTVWHPAVTSTQLAGSKTPRRLLILGDGSIVREELIDAIDGQSFTYKIIGGPLPVANYVSTLSIESVGNNKTRVEWTGSFDPASGTSKKDAKETMEGVYDAGLNNLKKMFPR